jgi:hypothetical protein
MKLINLDLVFADRKKLAMVAVSICIAFYIDAAFVLGWQIRSSGEMRQEIAKVQADIDGITRDMALMSRPAADEKKIAITGVDNIPELLRYISSVATDHAIRIAQITPVKSREVKTLQSQSYLILNVKLDVSGGYHDFGIFLNELSRGAHPFFAEDFRISQGDDYQKQRISVNLKTYVKK